MRDFFCKVYDKLYCFHGDVDMRLILGYESGGTGCARISFHISGGIAPDFLHAPRPLHLQSLKLQLHFVQCTIPPSPYLLSDFRLRVPDPLSPLWKTCPLSPRRGTPQELPRGSLPLQTLRNHTSTSATLFVRRASVSTSPLSNSQSSTTASSLSFRTAKPSSSPLPALPSTPSRP